MLVLRIQKRTNGMNTEQNNGNKITEFELISYFKAELSEDDRGRVEAWIDASEETGLLPKTFIPLYLRMKLCTPLIIYQHMTRLGK